MSASGCHTAFLIHAVIISSGTEESTRGNGNAANLSPVIHRGSGTKGDSSWMYHCIAWPLTHFGAQETYVHGCRIQSVILFQICCIDPQLPFIVLSGGWEAADIDMNNASFCLGLVEILEFVLLFNLLGHHLYVWNDCRTLTTLSHRH